MLDADAQEGIEQADGVFGDELFERDQERSTKGEHAVDRGGAVYIVSILSFKLERDYTHCSGAFEANPCQTA
jgi:hypothetical protein